MKKTLISEETFKKFLIKLEEDEKSEATKEKYMRDIKMFAEYCGEAELTKELVIAYKQRLIENGYAVRSVNSMIASLNSFFTYMERQDLKVKSLKIQQQIFCQEEKELKKDEYERLCGTAKKRKNKMLYLIIQTLCGTGIRISELKFVTAEAVKKGEAVVSLKGKIRKVFIVKKLQKILLKYMRENGICSGQIFVTRKGNAVSRTVVWREMKKLCKDAEVNPKKVFPHNLRHLFARVFYDIEKDIAKLADILGHSNINTTRIYIISTGIEHRKSMEKMNLIY